MDLIVKLYVVLLDTLGAVPDKTPVLAVNVSPLGKAPLDTLYVTGASPVADKLAVKLVCLIIVPRVPAAVVHTGTPEYCMPGTAIAVVPLVFTTYKI